jgi:hypothetical protein
MRGEGNEGKERVCVGEKEIERNEDNGNTVYLTRGAQRGRTFSDRMFSTQEDWETDETCSRCVCEKRLGAEIS